jgi:hypothetical protein
MIEFRAMKCVEMKANWKANWGKHCDQFDTLAKSKEQTTVTKFILRVILAIPTISPANCFLDATDTPERKLVASRGMDIYISIFVVILTSMLLGFTSQHQFWWLDISSKWSRVLIAFLPTFRIVDIVSYRLYFLFHKSVWKRWQPRYARRSLGIAFANLYEVVVAYAILFLLTGQVCNGNVLLKTGLDAAYFSLVTITTVGYGDFVATRSLSRILVMGELVTGLLLLIIIVPALVSLFLQPDESSRESGLSGKPRIEGEQGAEQQVLGDQPDLR